MSCTIGMGRVWFVHCGCTRLMPSPTHATHSFRSSASTGGTHTLPFSPSSVFPKARARPALLSNSVNTGAGGGTSGRSDLRVRSAKESNLGVAQGEILPLASEEQCCYSSLSQAAFRNSTEQMQNSTSTGQSTVPIKFSLAHV